MGMLLPDQRKYLRDYVRDTYYTLDWIKDKLKTVGSLIVNFPAILWIPFFLILTVLVKVFNG